MSRYDIALGKLPPDESPESTMAKTYVLEGGMFTPEEVEKLTKELHDIYNRSSDMELERLRPWRTLGTG